MKNSSSCDLSIQSLVESNLQFKDCLCSDDLYCTFNKLLGKKCINESGNTLLYEMLTVTQKKVHCQTEPQLCSLMNSFVFNRWSEDKNSEMIFFMKCDPPPPAQICTSE